MNHTVGQGGEGGGGGWNSSAEMPTYCDCLLASGWWVMSAPPDWCHLLRGLSQPAVTACAAGTYSLTAAFTVTQRSTPPHSHSNNTLLRYRDRVMHRLSVQSHHVESHQEVSLLHLKTHVWQANVMENQEDMIWWQEWWLSIQDTSISKV